MWCDDCRHDLLREGCKIGFGSGFGGYDSFQSFSGYIVSSLLYDGWRRTILNTGCTHQISGSCQIRFKLPFTRYTTSVLFSQSLDNLIVVALSRQPPIPPNILWLTLLRNATHLFSGQSLLFSQFLLQSHLLLHWCRARRCRSSGLFRFLGIRYIPVVLRVSVFRDSIGVVDETRLTSSDSSLSSSCHFDLAEGLGATTGGVEVPDVGSSISTVSALFNVVTL